MARIDDDRAVLQLQAVGRAAGWELMSVTHGTAEISVTLTRPATTPAPASSIVTLTPPLPRPLV